MEKNSTLTPMVRYYDPVLKRFISEDPIGLQGGFNLFGYVGGDPVSLLDPDGLKVRPGPNREARRRQEREAIKEAQSEAQQRELNSNTANLVSTNEGGGPVGRLTSNVAEPAGNMINSISKQNRFPSIETSAEGYIGPPVAPPLPAGCQLIFYPSGPNFCPRPPRIVCGPAIGPR